MKKYFKNLLSVTVALGSVVIFASACTTDSDSDVSYEKKSYSVEAESIKQISLSDKGRKVELEESKDNDIHITYFESDKESYDIHVSDNDELVMKLVTDKDWKDYVGFQTDEEHHIVKIAVPNGITSEVKIQTSKGDIVLTDLKIDGSIETITNGGKIELTNVTANKKLKMKTKNDDIKLNDVNIKDSIDATITKGNIKVSNVAVGDTLKLRTKDGDITGSVIGSYDVFKIFSEASKGKNNLPENKKSGNKTLDVGANNGDINLEFVK
ncbi:MULTISPECIES: DUF4097 family beta strand repeat-containing protein [unclassified Bacillus (in: firmicutes)]|uniref:DUF4097 family beta strand repeat-containing protein n=1 Tax=unclassified Bacillus (in: firmicutes) TaxID=185979 RepID=UPI000BF0DF0F|nr:MULTISPECIES: DUF4097 family beta strand repeat-containing protein [unclassified Bacillus (in: firmicutes)]PEJ60573.1 hypothetical protein CN692_00340 [Bacillus sp. AFS002410]PEL09916.1 hypothetical protein CN601_15365 [Bacillus sp. AFS017336]